MKLIGIQVRLVDSDSIYSSYIYDLRQIDLLGS